MIHAMGIHNALLTELRGIPIATDQWTRGLAYNNVTESLQRVGVAIIYIVANIALGIHLFHGSWSLFQSLGLNNPKYNRAKRYFATGFAAVIMIGNVSFPVLVQAHVVIDQQDLGNARRGCRVQFIEQPRTLYRFCTKGIRPQGHGLPFILDDRDDEYGNVVRRSR